MTRVIQNDDQVKLAILLGKTMEELKDKNPTFSMLNSSTYIVTCEEAQADNEAQIIMMGKPSYNVPKCKECPSYCKMEGPRREGLVNWGRCSKIEYAARNGDKPICAIRRKEIEQSRIEISFKHETEERKEVRA